MIRASADVQFPHETVCDPRKPLVGLRRTRRRSRRRSQFCATVFVRVKNIISFTARSRATKQLGQRGDVPVPRSYLREKGRASSLGAYPSRYTQRREGEKAAPRGRNGPARAARACGRGGPAGREHTSAHECKHTCCAGGARARGQRATPERKKGATTPAPRGGGMGRSEERGRGGAEGAHSALASLRTAAYAHEMLRPGAGRREVCACVSYCALRHQAQIPRPRRSLGADRALPCAGEGRGVRGRGHCSGCRGGGGDGGGGPRRGGGRRSVAAQSPPAPPAACCRIIAL